MASKVNYYLSSLSMNALDNVVNQHGARIGRMLIGLLFLVSGVGSLLGFKGFAGYAGMFLPMGTLMASLAIIFKIGGGLSLVLGIRTRLGAYALALFTLLTIALIHGPSWMKATDGMQAQSEMIAVLKNLAILGGLLLVAKGSSSQSSSSAQAS